MLELSFWNKFVNFVILLLNCKEFDYIINMYVYILIKEVPFFEEKYTYDY